MNYRLPPVMETSEPEHTPYSHLQLVCALHAELLSRLLQFGGDAGAVVVVVVVVVVVQLVDDDVFL